VGRSRPWCWAGRPPVEERVETSLRMASADQSSFPYRGVRFLSSCRSGSCPSKPAATARINSPIVAVLWSKTWCLIADRQSVTVPMPTGMM